MATGGGGSLLSPESSLTKICMVSSGSEEERAEVEDVGLEETMVSYLRRCDVVKGSLYDRQKGRV